jgi:D-xylulose reductase
MRPLQRLGAEGEIMKALVLEKAGKLSLRDIDIRETLGPNDVRIRVHTVGICGSDLHYYKEGRIGPYVVREPMVLGHEASGTVIEVGSAVADLKVTDRVCMEPGIPDLSSRAARLGMYNVDPSVRFWATPPVHGCLRESVVHPAAFTYRLSANVSYAEGALVEPLAVGVHAAVKAHIRPGDTAVVMGAGTIGMVTAMAALAGGCARIVITDVQQPKLDLAATLGAIVPVNVARQDAVQVVKELTGGWGAEVVFEASGNPGAIASVFEPLAPGGCAVLIGLPGEKVPFDIVAMQAKEARVETVFRYANVYDRAVELLASGKVNGKALITDTFPFDKAVEAFEYAAHMPGTSVKVQIVLDPTS